MPLSIVARIMFPVYRQWKFWRLQILFGNPFSTNIEVTAFRGRVRPGKNCTHVDHTTSASAHADDMLTAAMSATDLSKRKREG